MNDKLSTASNGDPFSLFEDDDDALDGLQSNNQVVLRDFDSCGVLSFHPNTEVSLLTHVNSVLSYEYSSKGSDGNAHDEYVKTSEKILEAIDDFCFTRHWMMHVGPEKASILKEVLSESVSSFHLRKKDRKNDQFIILELGTYCGYSAILFASHLLSLSTVGDKIHFCLISFEIDEGKIFSFISISFLLFRHKLTFENDFIFVKQMLQ